MLSGRNFGKLLISSWVSSTCLGIFCPAIPLLFSAHLVRGLPCCLDYVSISSMSRRVASTTFGLPSKRRTFWLSSVLLEGLLKFHAAKRLSPHWHPNN